MILTMIYVPKPKNCLPKYSEYKILYTNVLLYKIISTEYISNSLKPGENKLISSPINNSFSITFIFYCYQLISHHFKKSYVK